MPHLLNQALWNNSGLKQLRIYSENWSKVLDKKDKICLHLDICQLLIGILVFIWSAKTSEDTVQNQLVISVLITTYTQN